MQPFYKHLSESGVKVDAHLPLYFLSALMTKPFVLFTGLSGSGKTLIAQCFASWISDMEAMSRFKLLECVLSSEDFRNSYDVLSCNPTYTALVNRNGASGRIIPLPTNAIFEWYDAITNQDIGNINPQDYRHIVGERSAFQKHIHGFYGEFFKIAVRMHEQSNECSKTNEQQRSALIAVGADWTSNENLLGFPDALNLGHYRKPDNGALDLILRAQQDPEHPYFLILDEMNLSHVERYFADFLSAMESGEAVNLHDDTGADWDGVPAKLTIPRNLFVIGTVNVDETTYMFSPKVLDRANVIEFRVSGTEMSGFLANPAKPDLALLAGKGASFAKAFVAAAKQRDVALDEETREAVSKVLMEFFPPLQKAGAEFGYRTAHEICRFVYHYQQLSGDAFELEQALDAAIMQKLLPKLHGAKKKLGPVLDVLAGLCLNDELRARGVVAKPDELVRANARYGNALEKILRMQARLGEHGFASFAEAEGRADTRPPPTARPN